MFATLTRSQFDLSLSAGGMFKRQEPAPGRQKQVLLCGAGQTVLHL